MQSLDSRLADLFNEDGTTTELKSQTEASESDSDSDTDLIKRATRVLDMKQNNMLPGLGDLDKVSESTSQEQEAVIKSATANAAIDVKVNVNINSEVKTVSSAKSNVLVATEATFAPLANQATEATFAPLANQAIPVIGGIARVAVYIPPPVAAPAPVAYGGDALSFLSKIMGNAPKPNMVSTESTPVPSQPVVTQPSPITANYSWPTRPPVWPHTNPLSSSTVANSLWSSPPPLPTLPPPPVFSWAGKPDPGLPTQWQNVSSTIATPPQIPSIDPPISSSSVPVATSTNSVVAQPPLKSISPSQASNFGEPPATTAPPPSKRSKWDIKDTDYRLVIFKPFFAISV